MSNTDSNNGLMLQNTRAQTNIPAHSTCRLHRLSQHRHHFVSKRVLLRRSEVFFCVLLFALSIVLALVVRDITNKVETASHKAEFVSTSRAVSASLGARLDQVYSATGLMGHLASGSKVNNSTEKILQNFHRFMVQLDESAPSGDKSRKWINIVQVVPGDQRAEFEAEMNKMRESWVPEWANRTEDRRVQIRLPNLTYVDAPDGLDSYEPIVYRFPDSFFMWDLSTNDQVHPLLDWTQIDTNITTKCVAPAYSSAVVEVDYPVYVRCYGRVVGPRESMWSPSWALRIGYVLNEGLRSVVPDNLHEFEYSMFDITDLTPEQYALEGLYTHASAFNKGEIKVVSPFQSSIKGQTRYTVQDARSKAFGELIYENTVDYGNRVYLVVATGTSETLQNSASLSVFYSLIAFFGGTLLACFLAVFFATRNIAQRDQRLQLIKTNTAIAGRICYAMLNPLHSIMFTAKAINDAMDRLVTSAEADIDGCTDTITYSGLSESNKHSLKALVEAVSVLDATTGSMYDLVNSFMGMDQLSGSRRPLNVRKFDCIRIAEMVFAQHHIIHRDHLDMKMVNEVGSCVMNLDSVMFRQVLSNGFGNSCKVTPSGYVNLLIRWTAGHEFVEFIVEDSGPGLMGVDPEKLFMEYERGAKAASVKSETASTGLGLTISRKIAKKFGGTLHLEDRQETDGVSGARFVFRLPASAIVQTPEIEVSGTTTEIKAASILVVVAGTAQPGSNTPASAALSLEQVGVNENGLQTAVSKRLSDIQKRPIDMKQVKVAFAEDDAVNHAILKRMLNRIGCHLVGEFHDGQPMQELLCNTNKTTNNHKNKNKNNTKVFPDVVLLDVGMDNMNGDAAMREIRSAGCTVQCVALTGHTMPADLKDIMESGFDYVITKPYTTEDLETVILECVLGEQTRFNHASTEMSHCILTS